MGEEIVNVYGCICYFISNSLKADFAFVERENGSKFGGTTKIGAQLWRESPQVIGGHKGKDKTQPSDHHLLLPSVLQALGSLPLVSPDTKLEADSSRFSIHYSFRVHPLHMHSANCCVKSGPSPRIDMVMKSVVKRPP